MTWYYVNSNICEYYSMFPFFRDLQTLSPSERHRAYQGSGQGSL